jgi:hypothetical protein
MSCNGSGLRETLLNNHNFQGEDSAASGKRKEDVEKWAALLAAGAAQAQANLVVQGNAPAGWRHNVEAMTPIADQGTGVGQPNEERYLQPQNPVTTGNESAEHTLQVRVNIGELGELALIVERAADGVKVQISAQDGHVLEMLSSERDALTSALSAVGHSITSLAFVTMDRVGIKLAQPKVGPLPKKPQRAIKSAADGTPQSKRRSRRLNVIG